MPGVKKGVFLCCSPPHFFRQDLSLNLEFTDLACHQAPRDPLVPTFLVIGLQVGAGVLNSVLHACEASTLLTKTSPEPLVFNSFGHTLSGTPGSHSHSTPNFLRNCQIVFHSCTCNECPRVMISSHFHQSLLNCFFFF